jgi:hypothetical protein
MTTTKLQPAKPDEEPAPQALLPAKPSVSSTAFLKSNSKSNSTLTDHDFWAVLEILSINDYCPYWDNIHKNKPKEGESSCQPVQQTWVLML